MFKTENIEKLIKYSLLTGYIEGDNPTSLILISPPEHAKTSIIKGIFCKNTIETSDLSPKPIVDILIPKILNEHVHHIIIPDLVKPLSHKSTTVEGTIAFLNAVMEEGIQNNMFFGQVFNLPRPVKAGIITSVTPEFFNKYFKKWNDIGFLSRFIPVSYSYSKQTIAEIHELIRDNQLLSLYGQGTNATDGMKKKYYGTNGKKFKIEIPKNEAAFLSLQAQEIAKKLSQYKVKIYVQGGNPYYVSPNIIGFRLQRQLRMLASAIALSYNRQTVNMVDVEDLGKILEFIGFPSSEKTI